MNIIAEGAVSGSSQTGQVGSVKEVLGSEQGWEVDLVVKRKDSGVKHTCVQILLWLCELGQVPYSL